MNRRFAVVGLMLLSCFLLTGCPGGGSAGSGLKTYPVTGVVTEKGQPIAGATVTFHPAGEGRGASGTTDANGTYRLSTAKPADGAMAGEYKVTVVKFDSAAASGGSEEYVPPKETGGSQPPPAPKNLLPAKYAEANASGLTATVKEGDNKIDFSLE